MKLSDIEIPSNKKFGLFVTLVFLIFSVYLFSCEAIKLSYLSFGLSGLFFLVTLVKAEWLFPLNKLWMRLGLLLGIFFSPIILGVIFFGMLTPMSFVMRLLGRDELALKKQLKKTHWAAKKLGAVSSDSFKNQF